MNKNTQDFQIKRYKGRFPVTASFIKLRCLSLDINMSTAAQRAGISPSSFSHKIHGRTDWLRSEVVAVANVLEMTEDEVKRVFFAPLLGVDVRGGNIHG